MKPPIFEYHAPETLIEAFARLEEYGGDEKILAGGQSLMPLMNLRLARPRAIIDINRLSDLSYIQPGADGGLNIGALTRYRALERSSLVREKNPLLAESIPLIGHLPIRNRGTIGGSIVHSDPAAELPAVSIVLGAEFVLRGARSQRVLQANDFFLGTMTTAIDPGEILTEIRLPAWKPGLGWAVKEVTRRFGDFALAGIALLLELDGNDACLDVRIVLFGVGERPVRMEKAEAVLRGSRFDSRTLAEASRAVSRDLHPDSDVHASAEYRREVGGVLTRRALETALDRARKSI
jgi:carbon-monoxide dehydrogenase medium subunit